MKYEISQTTDKCVRSVNDGTKRNVCSGTFVYTINENGYICLWRCLRCGWVYEPTYKLSRNKKPYTLGVGCYKMNCKICSEKNNGLL